jgi:hypothetical protein
MEVSRFLFAGAIVETPPGAANTLIDVDGAPRKGVRYATAGRVSGRKRPHAAATAR